MNIQAALIYSILRRWRSFEWTSQGFGFLRTKIANVGRIHIWDSRLAVPLVSTVHSHPWPLKSTIISGELINCRFEYRDDEHHTGRGLRYRRSKIATGEGGGLLGDPDDVELMFANGGPELYLPGDVYEQAPQEIHRTIAQDGTVTLLERPQGPPLEEALTFWPAGTDWVSAEPSQIEDWRLAAVIEHALARWSA